MGYREEAAAALFGSNACVHCRAMQGWDAPALRSQLLVCPETKQRVTACSLADAAERMGASDLVPRRGNQSRPIGATSTVMLRDDHRCAYPVVGHVPVLLVPEQLLAERDAPSVDVIDIADQRYAESYEEMAHYNEAARSQTERMEAAPESAGLAQLLELTQEQRLAFPLPRRRWVDATYEPVAQWEAFRHLAPLAGKTVLQLGGKGIHAVRFLVAGAAQAWVMSPMIEELQHGRALAGRFGVEDRYRCVAGIAEEMPFADEAFDAVYSDSCVHHMVTELAAAECRRTLGPGGRFAAVEPWRAPFYRWGIKIFGKREKGVHCQPMTSERAAPFFAAFEEASVAHHGALTRYPLLALAQLGLELRPQQVYRITKVDDACCSVLPRVRRMGSSSAILAGRGRGR